MIKIFVTAYGHIWHWLYLVISLSALPGQFFFQACAPGYQLYLFHNELPQNYLLDSKSSIPPPLRYFNDRLLVFFCFHGVVGDGVTSYVWLSLAFFQNAP